MKRLVIMTLIAALVSGPIAPVLAEKPSAGDVVAVARLKYRGGGDWYNDPSIIPNLLREIRFRTGIRTAEGQVIVSLTDDTLFSYPFIFITGHGNIRFDTDETERLRTYLASGGFLLADDDYGMDESFRREMARIFPDHPLVELPFEHPVYHTYYDFAEGPPKIHEHYKGAPRGYGIYIEGRLAVMYLYNSNIGDGWADPDIHKDPPEVREAAFKMGVNIILYALTH